MSLRCNKFLVVVIFICCYAFVSCKKDDASRPLQIGEYTSDKAGDFSSVRLFAKSGEIKDQNLINAYKVKFAKDLNPANSGGAIADTFTVLDENNAKYGSRNFSVSKMDNFYQFTTKDTVTIFGQLDQVYYNIVKYKPYYISTPIPSSTGSNYLTTTLGYYYASTTPNGLVFPMINVIRFATLAPPVIGGNYMYYNNYKVNNVFDDKFPVNILTSDSVLVQTFNVYYKK
jgi:hypothetical protein